MSEPDTCTISGGSSQCEPAAAAALLKVLLSLEENLSIIVQVQ